MYIIYNAVKNSLLYIAFVSEIRVLALNTFFFTYVTEMVDVVDLKSTALKRVGSSPSVGIYIHGYILKGKNSGLQNRRYGFKSHYLYINKRSWQNGIAVDCKSMGFS